MTLPARWVRALPWILCAATLTVVLVDTAVRFATRQRPPLVAAEAWPWATLIVLPYALGPVIGALTASRRPRNPCGWLLWVFGSAVVLQSLANGLAQAGAVPLWAPKMGDGLTFLALTTCLTFLFLLFPGGRLSGPQWRLPARATLVAAGGMVLLAPFARLDEDPRVVSPWALDGAAADTLTVVILIGAFGLIAMTLAAAGSVLARYRRADGVERQQLKWFMAAAAVNGLLLLASFTPVGEDGVRWQAIQALGFGLVPVAVGVAVLRYRLYEIDRIVSRTVSYAVMTGGLVVLYVAVVTALRPLLSPLTGTSDLAVAVSTLTVAAAFGPVRRRVQAIVDRRFDRARYDAARTVDAYARRLRTQVDLAAVTGGLRETVAATVGPQRVGVWLRGSRPAPDGTAPAAGAPTAAPGG